MFNGGSSFILSTNLAGEWGMGNGAWGMGHGAWGMGHGAWGMGNKNYSLFPIPC